MQVKDTRQIEFGGQEESDWIVCIETSSDCLKQKVIEKEDSEGEFERQLWMV